MGARHRTCMNCLDDDAFGSPSDVNFVINCIVCIMDKVYCTNCVINDLNLSSSSFSNLNSIKLGPDLQRLLCHVQ